MKLIDQDAVMEKDKNTFVVDQDIKKTFSDKVYALTGQNPLKCKKCGHIMELVQIWVKGKGYVFDLLEYLESQATSPPNYKIDTPQSKKSPLKSQEPLPKQMDLLSLLDTIVS